MGNNGKVSEWSWLIEEMKASPLNTSIQIPMKGAEARDLRKEKVTHVRNLCRYHGLKVSFWRLGKLQYVRLEGRFQVVTSVPLQNRER